MNVEFVAEKWNRGKWKKVEQPINEITTFLPCKAPSLLLFFLLYWSPLCQNSISFFWWCFSICFLFHNSVFIEAFPSTLAFQPFSFSPFHFCSFSSVFYGCPPPLTFSPFHYLGRCFSSLFLVGVGRNSLKKKNPGRKGGNNKLGVLGFFGLFCFVSYSAFLNSLDYCRLICKDWIFN